MLCHRYVEALVKARAEGGGAEGGEREAAVRRACVAERLAASEVQCSVIQRIIRSYDTIQCIVWYYTM